MVKTEPGYDTSCSFELCDGGDYVIAFVITDVRDGRWYRKEEPFSVSEKRTRLSRGFKNNEKTAKKPPMKVIITVDTEHNRDGTPLRISGDLTEWGIEENFGVNAIMDILEEHGMKGVFFVNVYEAYSFGPGYENYMSRVMADMHVRGHEVGLHCHEKECDAAFAHSEFGLDQLTFEQQKERLEQGCRFIERIINERPISFRSGAYRINEYTLKALKEIGIKVDSSLFYLQKNNAITAWPTISQVCSIDGITEFPIVPVADSSGIIRKLDLDSLSLEDIICALSELKSRDDFPYCQLMFHSFSFLDTNRISGKEPIVSYEYNRFMCFGGDTEKKKKFGELLEFLRSSPDFEVTTFRELCENSIRIPLADSDGVGVGSSEKARLAAEEFSRNNYHVEDYKNVIHIPRPKDIIRKDVGLVQRVLVYRVRDYDDMLRQEENSVKTLLQEGKLIFNVEINNDSEKEYIYRFQIGQRGKAPIKTTGWKNSPSHEFVGVPADTYFVKCLIKHNDTVVSFHEHNIVIPWDLPAAPRVVGNGLSINGKPSALDAVVDSAVETVSKNRINFKVDLKETKGVQMAFQLEKNGRLMAQLPYSDEPGCVFENLEPGKYRIKFYLKRKDEKKSYWANNIIVPEA
ncbi:MAG: polysaccharide deacetylase family protein [Clostridia bacterium]|nr:polysaccharide deacetylase family protein [Clostridia bacterium]